MCSDCSQPCLSSPSHLCDAPFQSPFPTFMSFCFVSHGFVTKS